MRKKLFSIVAALLLLSAGGIAQDLVLKGGIILTITQGTIEKGTIVIQKGKITAVGKDVKIPSGIKVIDITGKYVMPGIIDTHVHFALTDLNETSNPMTPQIWMKYGLLPGDDSILQTLTGGVTTVKTMHGSANVVGGVNVTIKLKYDHPVEEMIVKGVRQQLKLALGENPKRIYGRDKGQFPSTRMGNAQVMRKAFEDAQVYKAKWDKYEKDKAAAKKDIIPPQVDLRMETLKMVLEKKLAIDCHTYRSDEIVWIINFCKEFDIDLLTLSHCNDGYKVADIMAEAGVSYGGWVDSWGGKEESYDNSPYGIKLMHDAGVNVVVNTDSIAPNVVRYLHLEAAKVLKYNDLPDVEALKMITINAAKSLEMGDHVGSIEKGKDGDVAVFNKYPLDSTSKCLMTIIEGKIFWDYEKAGSLMKESNND